MLEWVEATKNQEDLLLDKMGDPQRPSYFIIEAIGKEEAHPTQRKIPLSQNVAEGVGQHRVRLL